MQPKRVPQMSKETTSSTASTGQGQQPYSPQKRSIFANHRFKRYGSKKGTVGDVTDTTKARSYTASVADELFFGASPNPTTSSPPQLPATVFTSTSLHPIPDGSPPASPDRNFRFPPQSPRAAQRHKPANSSQSSFGSSRDGTDVAAIDRRTTSPKSKSSLKPSHPEIMYERPTAKPSNSRSASKRLGVKLDIPTEPVPFQDNPDSYAYSSTWTSQSQSSFTSSFDSVVTTSSTNSARRQFLSQFAYAPAPPPLETLQNGRLRFVPSSDTEPETFYASSSEDEEDTVEESQYSSQYSTRSSATSYGVNSPQLDEGLVKFDGEEDRGWFNDYRPKRSIHSSELEFQPQFPAISEVSSDRTLSTEDISTSRTSAEHTTKSPNKQAGTRRGHSRNFSRPSISLSNGVLRTSSGAAETLAHAGMNNAEERQSNEKKPVGEEKKAPFTERKGRLAGLSSAAGQRTDDTRSARPLSLAIMKESEAMISSAGAEAVIINVFENVDAFKDLFSLARMNRGFYNVFKRHELELMKNTLRNISTAAWELRESSPKEIIAAMETSKSEYTPTRYIQFHTRDTYILIGLKSAIFSRCQALLRPETASIIQSRDPTKLAKVDDALWRVWTFCNLFGGEKRREDDLESQLDWLRGGVKARTLVRPSTSASNRTGRSNESRLGRLMRDAPPYFGRGNPDGLTADELFDMMEMWNCIKALLSKISEPSRVSQARQHGVFDGHTVLEGDLQGEQSLLVEWTHYLATLGPCTIVDLATDTISESDAVFVTAEDMGWNSWSLSTSGASRKGFLQDAVSQIYGERLKQAQDKSVEEASAEVKMRRRSRRVSLLNEIKEKRKSVDLNEFSSSGGDRPMSLWVQWINKLDSVDAAIPTENPPTVDANKSHSAAEPPIIKASKPRPVTSSQPPRRIPSLSLFPPQYSRNNTPSSSARASPVATPTGTPMRSRAPSLRSVEGGPKGQSPANSRRPSVLRLASNNSFSETLREEPRESEEEVITPERRPMTAGATVSKKTPPLSRSGSSDMLSSRARSPRPAVRPSTAAGTPPPSAPPTAPLPPTPPQSGKFPMGSPTKSANNGDLYLPFRPNTGANT